MLNIIVLNLHILAAGFLLAVLILGILFLRKKTLSKEKVDILRTTLNVGGGTIIWMILTGAFLFTDRSQTFVTSILFWIKIGLFIFDLVVGLVLVNRKLRTAEKAGSSSIIAPVQIIYWVGFNIILTIGIIVLSITIAK